MLKFSLVMNPKMLHKVVLVVVVVFKVGRASFPFRNHFSTE